MHDWHAQALCAVGDHGLPPTAWDGPPDLPANEWAIIVCRDCPVRAECAADADAEPQRSEYLIRAGVWRTKEWLRTNPRRTQRRPKSFTHGTRNGAQRHRRKGEPPCGPCLAAERDFYAARHIDRKAHRRTDDDLEVAM